MEVTRTASTAESPARVDVKMNTIEARFLHAQLETAINTLEDPTVLRALYQQLTEALGLG